MYKDVLSMSSILLIDILDHKWTTIEYKLEGKKSNTEH